MMDELVREIRARGTLAAIPRDVCQRHRIGADRVAMVWLYIAECADDSAHSWPAVRTIVANTGIAQWNVQTALKVLIEARLITPAGQQGRANVYFLDVSAWPPAVLASQYDSTSRGRTGERTGERTGGGTGGGTGIPVPKSREGKRSHDAQARADAQQLPMLVAAADLTSDEKQKAMTVLANMPSTGRPDASSTVIRIIVTALRRGHTVNSIRRHLDPPRISWDKVAPGAVVVALRELASGQVAPPADPWAGEPAPQAQPAQPAGDSAAGAARARAALKDAQRNGASREPEAVGDVLATIGMGDPQMVNGHSHDVKQGWLAEYKQKQAR